MPRSARGRDGYEAEGLLPTQTDGFKPRARHERQEDETRGESSHRSRAKRDDAPKGDVGVEAIYPTPPFGHDRATTTRPGTMSVIPTPGISIVPSPVTTMTTRHPRFSGNPRPPPPTTTTRRTGFFASGRPHPGGNWGRPNNSNNFFRPPHDRNGGFPPTLPPYAIALIAFGVLFVILGAIATIVCCRGNANFFCSH